MSSAECQALHSLRFQSHRASTSTYAPLPLRECLIRHLRVLITLCGNEAGASNGWDRGSRILYNHPRRKLTQSCRSDHSQRLLRSKLVENGLLRNDHSCHAQCNTTSVLEKQNRRKRSKDGVAMESATPCSTCFDWWQEPRVATLETAEDTGFAQTAACNTLFRVKAHSLALAAQGQGQNVVRGSRRE